MPTVKFTDLAASIKVAVEHERDPLKSDIPFTRNLHYQQVVDLRSQGIDAILHLNSKMTGKHKIKLIEAGHKCAGEIYGVLAQIIDSRPDEQEVSRVDSCADICDGPSVRAIVQTVRSRYAQWQAQFGNVDFCDDAGEQVQWSEMGKREVQTMYAGKKPNCFRIYDKKAERLNVWKLERRRHERLASHLVSGEYLDTPEGIEESALWRMKYPALKPWRRDLDKRFVAEARERFHFPDFETWMRDQCAGPMGKILEFPKLPQTITRVERQMGAGRVPHQLDRFEKVFSKKAVDFNPFTRLNFSPFDASTEIDPDAFSPVEHLAGMMIQHLLETGTSWQQMFAFLNRERNGKRYQQKFAPFIAAGSRRAAGETINPEELYENYRDSLTRQMAA